MKKFSLLIAGTMVAGGILLSPSTTKAQADKRTEFEPVWYEACYGKRDAQKCYEMSKELLEKYPESTYRAPAQRMIKNYDQNKAGEKFQADLKTYYSPPQEAAKLDQLFAAGESYLKIDPGNQYVIAHMALAGANGAVGQVYKDLGKIKGYADTALKSFASATPPESWKTEEWVTMRSLVQAQMNQYLAWMLINQVPDPAQVPKADQEQALAYVTMATQIKGKEGAGWKDPHNYWLRSVVYSNQYLEVKKKYDAMTDDEKNSDAGKEILKKANELLDTKLIPEYARVLATATRQENKNFYDAAKPSFDDLWKYRTGAQEKSEDYIKSYTADPTIASVAVPAKAESDNTATVPATSPSNLKVAPGKSAVTPGIDETAAPSQTKGKSKSTKGKSSKGGSKRKGKRR